MFLFFSYLYHASERDCHKCQMSLMIIKVTRKLPDGEVREVSPFHMSMEGNEMAVICRDDEDYDAMVKVMCIAAWRKNVIIIIHAVVSNHAHAAVLATDRRSAQRFGEEAKRVYSMWLHHKYGERNFMDGTSVQALPMESNSHVRNALAYIPRNALDNKCRIVDYPWSGYGAMFSQTALDGAIKASELTTRQFMAIFHTSRKVKGVPWLLDQNYRLVPRSFCDWEYLEQAFNHDCSYWLKTIGSLNSAQMREQLIDSPREMKSDSEFYKSVNELSLQWFGKGLKDISVMQKCRILPYVYRTFKTTFSQLGRVFSIEQERIKELLCR